MFITTATSWRNTGTARSGAFESAPPPQHAAFSLVGRAYGAETNLRARVLGGKFIQKTEMKGKAVERERTCENGVREIALINQKKEAC